MRSICFIVVACLVLPAANAQDFQNGDLDGTVAGLSSLPDLWPSVPYTDPACEATNAAAASPDLASATAPEPTLGVAGTPFSGATYVGGVHGASTNNFFHEGIMQEVSGFTPGELYTIGFHQSVDARYLCEDTSGAWTVYVDNVFAGLTAASSSQVASTDPGLEWDFRQVVFTATATTHTIKFLPTDDDNEHEALAGDLGGALSMGIDMIELSPYSGESVLENALTVNAYYDPAEAALWVSDPLFANAQYTLLDMSGRVVHSGTLSHPRIGMEALPEGVFLLRFPALHAVQRFVKH